MDVPTRAGPTTIVDVQTTGVLVACHCGRRGGRRRLDPGAGGVRGRVGPVGDIAVERQRGIRLHLQDWHRHLSRGRCGHGVGRGRLSRRAAANKMGRRAHQRGVLSGYRAWLFGLGLRDGDKCECPRGRHDPHRERRGCRARRSGGASRASGQSGGDLRRQAVPCGHRGTRGNAGRSGRGTDRGSRYGARRSATAVDSGSSAPARS